MRTFLAMLSLLAFATPAPAAGPVFDDPRGLVVYAYEPYESGEFSEDFTELFSPTLKQLWDAMAVRSEAVEMPIIDFDPFVNAQHYQLSDLIIADPVVSGDAATVAVSFDNFGESQDMRFMLVRRAEGWKIDDIEAFGAYPWRHSEQLAADPMHN
jgi:hypothetical protein